MSTRRECDVAIAGAGPAGLATALNLLRLNPEFAGRVVAIERARHPRFKVCAGGLIPRTVAALDELGVTLDVPKIEVFGGAAQTEGGTIELPTSREPLCTIVRRDEFDAMLARRACEAGLEIVADSRVVGVEQDRSAVRIATDRGSIQAQVLVGADGSGSRVRTSLFGQRKHNVGRALIAEMPVNPERAEEFIRRIYRFDFRCVRAGVAGYCWSFPCLIEGRSCLNLGIYQQHAEKMPAGAARPDLRRELSRAFPETAACVEAGQQLTVKAFPIRWYDARDQYMCGRTILAGDAAGVDPLMGEGISCAFEHGKLAAAAVARYLDGQGSALHEYGNELHRGQIGRKLRRLSFAARRFYGPRHRLYFRLARVSTNAQTLGVAWYNGARRADELTIRQAVMTLARAILCGTTPQ